MPSKIIKQGSTRAASIQQFVLSEDPLEIQPPADESMWPDVPSIPHTPHRKTVSPPEPIAPPVDPVQLEKAAYENGFLQGEKAGMEIAEQKAEVVMGRYAESILELSKFKSSLYAQVEREVVKLAVAVAKKIIHREIQADPDIIQTLVRVALSHVAEKSAVTVHLNPVDYNYLLERRAELSQSEGRDISLLADKSVERGGCLIQTECGDIDARIEEKFREVGHAFFEDYR